MQNPALPRLTPRAALCHAARGLYCQMYYWGRDVRHPHRNLLVAQGFVREPRVTAGGTSVYRLAWEGGTVELHGTRAGWRDGHGKGVLFSRPQGTWRLPGATGGSGESAAPAAPRADEMIVENVLPLLRWLVAYEREALRKWSARERHGHYRDYLKLRPRRWWLPPALSLSWFSRFCESPSSLVSPKRFAESASRFHQ